MEFLEKPCSLRFSVFVPCAIDVVKLFRDADVFWRFSAIANRNVNMDRRVRSSLFIGEEKQFQLISVGNMELSVI